LKYMVKTTQRVTVTYAVAVIKKVPGLLYREIV
jgi:hypothetical protein